MMKLALGLCHPLLPPLVFGLGVAQHPVQVKFSSLHGHVCGLFNIHRILLHETRSGFHDVCMHGVML